MKTFDLSAYTAWREELRLIAYDDATGKPVPLGAKPIGKLTNGYGHTGPDVFVGQQVSPPIAAAWLARDLSIAARGVAQALGVETWARLDYVRRIAVADMCFTLGEPHFAGFEEMVHAIRAFNWPEAAAECRNSHWHKQAPERCEAAAEMLRTGQPPAGWLAP